MKLKIESKLLTKQINLITKLVNEATVIATKDEFSIVEMDPANVAMVIFKLHSSAFVMYELAKDKDEEKIGINLTNLKKFLKRAKEDDVISMELKDNQLYIDVGTKRHYTLPLIEIEAKDVKIPNLKFKAKIGIPVGEFEAAIEDAAIVAESFAIVAKGETATMIAEGELSTAKIDLEGEKVTVKAEEESRSKYSIEYLTKMVSKSLGATELTIHFGKDYPMKLVYTSDTFSLSYILAPRVDND